MTSKKTLLLVNGNQFGYSAGHYYYCKYLKERYTIHYVCYDRGKEKMDLPGVNVHYIPFGTKKVQRLFSLVSAAIRMSRSLRPDIVFVVYFNLSFLLALFCRAKGSTVLDIRTGSLHKNRLRRLLLNSAINIQAWFYNKKIILSESLLNKIRLSRKNTLVLPLGAEIFYSGGHSFERIHLLYVGTLNGRRIYETIEGLGIFLTRFPHLLPETRYDIIGFGNTNELNKLSEIIKKYNLEHTVFFHGELNHHHIGRFFETANIGVAYIPMEEYYQFQPATKIFEYALSGVFTIATSTYENKLLITHENGILCNDNPESFAKALESYSAGKHKPESDRIRSSLLDYEWKSLVEYKLEPFLAQ